MKRKMDYLKGTRFKQIFRMVTAGLILAVIILVGCQGQSLLDVVLSDTSAEPAITPTPQATLLAETAEAVAVTPTATEPANIQLTVWVPPQFSPFDESDAASLLTDQFKAFMTENPVVNLDIRVKATSGAGNMLDVLEYASQVAPDAMPSLVLLTRADLEQAAQKGLLQPIDEISSTIDESDWYSFAQAMGIVQGTTYGLPFAADALSLVYRNASLTSNQPTWNDLQVQLDSLVFPAADPAIQTTLALYFSAGGSVQDAQGQPYIDADALTQTLTAYQLGVKSGLINAGLLDLQSDDQAWEYFQNNESDGALTWASRQLQNSTDFKLALLPSLGESSVTLAKGWVWCLLEQDAFAQQYAGKLIEYLVQPDFLAKWAPQSGYLPVRPSSLNAWENTVSADTLSKMLTTAQLRPINGQGSNFNNGIKTAVQEILSNQSQPAESTQKAIDSLEVVE
jgi:multiple sugar transport system substrate-binding protein